jgi:dihydrofolate reductase
VTDDFSPRWTVLSVKIDPQENNMSTETSNRKVVANITLSLDGRVSGSGGEYDMSWIVPHALTDGARDHMIKVTMAATTVLLGRKNYEGFSNYWPSVAEDDRADARDRAFSNWLNETEKVVFSTTLHDTSWRNTRIVNDDPVVVVAQLHEQPGGDIIVLASRSIIRALLHADAIDQLSITLCPELPGGGARLFDDDLPATAWRLQLHTPTDTGAICLLYDRVRSD